MTKEEILHKHISKECMDELSENVWPDMLDAMEEYALEQVKKSLIADVGETCAHDYKPYSEGFVHKCEKCNHTFVAC